MQLNNLTLFLTTDCNLTCSYCYVGDKISEVMDLSVAKRSIDYFAGHCDKRISNVTLFGGEPLLSQKLMFDVIEMIKRSYPELSLSMTTNGTLLTGKVYEKLRQNHVFIQLSLDGYGEHHDRYRKFKNGLGSFELIQKNIKNKPDIPVRMTVTSENVKDLEGEVRDLYQMGIREISFYTSREPSWDEDALLLYENQYQGICDFYVSCYQKGDQFRINPIDDIIRSNVCRIKRSCLMGLKMISVLPNGTIYPCHRINFKSPDFAIGHIDEGGITDESLKELEKQLYEKDEICKTCALRNRCKVCPMENYYATGSMTNVCSLLCRINQINIIQADKMAAELYKANKPYFLKYFNNREM